MTYILLGFSLGLSAGLSPGPLLALLLQRSLQHGRASGVRVAIAPLLTDIPIVTVALLLVGRLPTGWVRGLLAIGGVFVLWLAIDAWRTAGRPAQAEASSTPQQDIVHAALVNFLNPHPYLFWLTVGAPMVVHAWRMAPWMAVGFVLAFYGLLVGSKVVVAMAMGSARFARRHERWLRLSALLLLVAGVWMLFTAWQGGLA